MGRLVDRKLSIEGDNLRYWSTTKAVLWKYETVQWPGRDEPTTFSSYADYDGRATVRIPAEWRFDTGGYAEKEDAVILEKGYAVTTEKGMNALVRALPDGSVAIRYDWDYLTGASRVSFDVCDYNLEVPVPEETIVEFGGFRYYLSPRLEQRTLFEEEAVI